LGGYNNAWTDGVAFGGDGFDAVLVDLGNGDVHWYVVEYDGKPVAVCVP
jgi:Ethanolamine utilization protein EutJ (predicted chaperonin)